VLKIKDGVFVRKEQRLSVFKIGYWTAMLGWVKKGKAIPLQAWTGPQGSRRVRLPDFKTINT
jgi:hypothetical protein